MTDHKNIATALATAQQEMGKALKDSNNPHFKSKYADLSSVSDACLSALNKNGIAVIQPFEVADGGEYFVRTTFLHGSGESLSCPIPLILGKRDMQGLGSAITYARRFGLMSLAGIAPEDDDANATIAQPDDRREPTQRATPPQAKPEARDPRKVADWLVSEFNKARDFASIKKLQDNAKATEAWEWLEAEKPPMAAEVKKAETAALARVDPAMQRPADDKAA